jgi:hypothetical protein
MDKNVKLKFRPFRRTNGICFLEDRETRQQGSFKTKDEAEAERLLNAKNEAHGRPGVRTQNCRDPIHAL